MLRLTIACGVWIEDDDFKLEAAGHCPSNLSILVSCYSLVLARIILMKFRKNIYAICALANAMLDFPKSMNIIIF